MSENLDYYARKTRYAVLGVNLLNEPLVALYSLLAAILHKSLGASAFELSLFSMLKPVVALLSFYWSIHLEQRKDTLRNNLVGANVLACLPFILAYWVDTKGFLIAAAALYMLFSRAGIPAWMEILKRNLSTKIREKTFSLGASLAYVEGLFVAFFLGTFLDRSHDAWKGLLLVTSLLSLVAVWIPWRLRIRGERLQKEPAFFPQKLSLWQTISMPWKRSWQLMQSRPDFAQFQWSFMACGFGIMIIQPALPFFLIDRLHLSYIDLAIAISMCKGLGFVATSSLWAKAMRRLPIPYLTTMVFILVGFFPLLLLVALWKIYWLYVAYIVYGVAQAGSHLLWHLSGPIFSGKEDSSHYSAVNVVMVGLRGVIAPTLGGVLCVLGGPLAVLSLGVGCCFYGSWRIWSRRSYFSSIS